MQDFQQKNQIVMKLYREIRATEENQDKIFLVIPKIYGEEAKYIIPIDITEEEIIDAITKLLYSVEYMCEASYNADTWTEGIEEGKALLSKLTGE